MSTGIVRLAAAYSLEEIRQVPKAFVRDFEILLLPARSRWLFVPDSLEVDDNATWLLPTGQDESVRGRWGVWVIEAEVSAIVIADVTGLQAALDSKLESPIAESDVMGLVSDLSTLSAAIATEASARATADALLVPKARVLTTIAPLKIAGAGSADLSADRTLTVDDATIAAKGVVQLATPSADVTAGHVVQASDARLSDARTPLAHTHPESDVTSLVGDLAAKEATANKGAASGYASLDAGTKVVENPANATATPTASKIPIADGSGKLDSWITPGSTESEANKVLRSIFFR